MGDMADDFLDSVIDYEDEQWAHDHGQCDPETCPWCNPEE